MLLRFLFKQERDLCVDAILGDLVSRDDRLEALYVDRLDTLKSFRRSFERRFERHPPNSYSTPRVPQRP